MDRLGHGEERKGGGGEGEKLGVRTSRRMMSGVLSEICASAGLGSRCCVIVSLEPRALAIKGGELN